ncbi:MAG: hypothetical protein ACYCX9_07585 [Candidatus Dormibacteria bacterium]
MRNLVRSADELRMIRGLVGYASSLAALGAAPGLGAALARTVPGVPSYLERKGEDFATIVARKQRQRVEVAGGLKAARELLDAGRPWESVEPRDQGPEPTGPVRPGDEP